MPLPSTPLKIDPIRDIPSTQRAIDALQRYLGTMVNSFDNAAGAAVLPVEQGGQGGGGALTPTDAPTGLTYTPGIDVSSVNNTNDGFIDITFVLPARAVGAEVFYRELPSGVGKQSYANASPYRLIALRAGSTYALQLAGEAANGSLGPRSPAEQVTLTSGHANIAPGDAHYVVTQMHTDLTAEHVLSGEATVITTTVAPTTVTLGIAVGGITTAKLADSSVTTDKINSLAVTTPKLADLSITTAKLADDSVDGAKLRNSTALSVIGRSLNSAGNPGDILATANDTVLIREADALLFAKVTNNMLGDNAVATAKLADNSVTTPKVVDANITTPKIATLAVTTALLADDAVAELKLQNNAVTTNKIANLAVTTAKLDANSVTTAKRQLLVLYTGGITLTGTGAAVEIMTQSFAVTHSLGRIPNLTPTIITTTGETATARIMGVTAAGVSTTAATIIVRALFIGSTATINSTLNLYYW